MQTITAHGKTHTAAEARLRITELQAENAAYGASDGRVTEINALTTALNTAQAETAPAPAPAPARRLSAAQRSTEVSAQVAAAERELAYTERNTHGSGRIEYFDHVGTAQETRRVANYTTRDGFLRGFIKYNTSARYDTIHVDGN